MNYQVLARKWRPSNFTEVVGQDHVVKPLVNALQNNRLHHAYLFTGTRGVGKTTIARILAKAINCENLQNFNPCGKCSICLEFSEGRFLDLIEVDAASRTKVEDTRDLLDNAQYAPHHGRFKIYLIDEVHMLSGHSFNALLKTLEEPPPHVKFLLATTDPQKIPVTVLSRCLQFNLKRVLPEQIFQQISMILTEEHIESEPQALKLIARAADGSIRDALSLLDQAIVFGGGTVSLDSVSGMLGSIGLKPVEDILIALAKGESQRILEIIDDVANIQSDFKAVLEQILHVLYRVALAQQLPKMVNQEFDGETVAALAQQISREDVQLYYQIALIGQKDLDLAPNSRMGFEMLMLRMLVFRPVKSSENAVPNARNLENLVTQSDVNLPIVTAPNPEIRPIERALPSAQLTIYQTVRPAFDQNWPDMIVAMRLESLTKELANNCVLDKVDEKSCQLRLDASHKHLLTPTREQKLQKALQEYFGYALKLIVSVGNAVNDTPAALLIKNQEERQQAAIEAINSDVNIQALKEHFDASIIPGSIEPV